MFVSHIFVSLSYDEESTGSPIPYIIITDSEAEDVTLLAAPDPQEADPKESSEEDPTEEDSLDEDPIEANEPLQALIIPTPPIHPSPICFTILVHPGQEIPLRHPYRTCPNGKRMMRKPGKTVHPPFTPPPAIHAVIAEEIAAPPRKRYRSSSPSSTPYSPPPSPSPSLSHKRCRSQSPPPLLLSLPPTLLPPRKRFWMTSPQQETTDETKTKAIIPARLCKKSQARRESSLAAHVLLVTGESIHHNVSLLAARVIHYEDQIEEIQDHLEEILLERVESVEQEIKTIHERVEVAEQQIEVLHDSLGIAQEIITESHIRIEDAEAHLQESEFRKIKLRACVRRLED
ncbi:hypothetical protein Tco_1243604 [Tanacetum coccineum]